MKFKSILIIFLIISCAPSNYSSQKKNTYNSTGFAYIYNTNDFEKSFFKKNQENIILAAFHNKLRINSLIKITNPKTNDFVVLKNSKITDYPDLYKIMITRPVADKLNLQKELPFVEITEIKKNKSFVAKKTKIFKEERQIHSNAPIGTVKIDNISKTKNLKLKTKIDKIYMVIGEFYSQKSALMLKKRIINELTNFDAKNLKLKTEKANKTKLLSGPYSSINLMKNDYSKLKDFGFEELDIIVNE